MFILPVSRDTMSVQSSESELWLGPLVSWLLLDLSTDPSGFSLLDENWKVWSSGPNTEDVKWPRDSETPVGRQWQRVTYWIMCFLASDRWWKCFCSNPRTFSRTEAPSGSQRNGFFSFRPPLYQEDNFWGTHFSLRWRSCRKLPSGVGPALHVQALTAHTELGKESVWQLKCWLYRLITEKHYIVQACLNSPSSLSITCVIINHCTSCKMVQSRSNAAFNHFWALQIYISLYFLAESPSKTHYKRSYTSFREYVLLTRCGFTFFLL